MPSWAPFDLRRYRELRDASKTNEPFDDRDAKVSETVRGAFVVQQHAATRMHWDLRLEASGVLLCWAVPKGPSLNPKSRRLAVETEPHPLAYLDFEGVIPKSEYGGGKMIVWDRGDVTYPKESIEKGYQNGKISFELHGCKLGGRFTLLRSGKDHASSPRPAPTSKQTQWLLLKKRDEYAKDDEIVATAPLSVYSGRPVEAATNNGPTRVENDQAGLLRQWAYRSPHGMIAANHERERYHTLPNPNIGRVRVYKRGNVVGIANRDGHDITSSFSEIAAAVRSQTQNFVAEGLLRPWYIEHKENMERICAALAARLSGKTTPTMQLVLFDLLEYEDDDLTSLPMQSRFEELKIICEKTPFIARCNSSGPTRRLRLADLSHDVWQFSDRLFREPFIVRPTPNNIAVLTHACQLTDEASSNKNELVVESYHDGVITPRGTALLNADVAEDLLACFRERNEPLTVTVKFSSWNASAVMDAVVETVDSLAAAYVQTAPTRDPLSTPTASVEYEDRDID